MTLPDTFNSIPYNRLPEQSSSRTLLGVKYPWSVNMMLSRRNHAQYPGGTYVYQTKDHVQSQWNMVDQVLVRPDALTFWQKNSLRILTAATVDGYSLLNDASEPDAAMFSDHLPILFQLHGDVED